MPGPNLADYVEVKDRIEALYAKYPTASLQSDWSLVDVKGVPYIVVHARAYRDDTDTHPGEGTSWLEVPGKTNFTRGSEIENAETSAWGRAIAALGFETKRGIATRDEIESRVAEPPASAPRTAPAPRNVTSGGTDTPAATGLSAGQQGKWRSWLRAQKPPFTEDQARAVMASVTGKFSTKDMTQADFDRLIELMENAGSEVNGAIIQKAREDFA